MRSYNPGGTSPPGLGWSAFARRYWRSRCCFLLLGVLRCFSSPGWLGHPGINARLTAPPGLSRPPTPDRLLAPRHPPHALTSLATPPPPPPSRTRERRATNSTRIPKARVEHPRINNPRPDATTTVDHRRTGTSSDATSIIPTRCQRSPAEPALLRTRPRPPRPVTDRGRQPQVLVRLALANSVMCILVVSLPVSTRPRVLFLAGSSRPPNRIETGKPPTNLWRRRGSNP